MTTTIITITKQQAFHLTVDLRVCVSCMADGVEIGRLCPGGTSQGVPEPDLRVTPDGGGAFLAEALTPDGEALLALAEEQDAALVAAMLERCSAPERGALAEGMSRVAAA